MSDLPVSAPTPEQVTILLGANQPSALEILEYRKDPVNQRAPHGLRTHFEWCISGPISLRDGPFSCNHIFLANDDEELVRRFRQFIGQEAYGDDVNRRMLLSNEEKRAITILESSIRHVDGHYEVALEKINRACPIVIEKRYASFFLWRGDF